MHLCILKRNRALYLKYTTCIQLVGPMEGAYFPLVNQLYETQFYGFPPSDYTDESE